MPTQQDAIMSMLEAVSGRLEQVGQKLEQVGQKLDRTADLVEANTRQVATFTEGLTRLENLVEKGFGNLEELIRQQHETTRMQAQHIDRLTGIVERLLERVA
jgi:ABC-type transporter Mla subunit MlaD